MGNTTFETLKKEGIIKNESALWMKSKLNAQPGRLYLTNNRIVYVKNANPFAGLLILLLIKSTRNKILYDIELGTIKDISRESFGANKNIMAITHGSDQTVKFSVNNFENWESDIKKYASQN